MFGSNGFNICPHCGKANSLNARYCATCGQQLSVPEEVIVCPKCHKTNSPRASYCGSCGAPLRTKTATKICPRCNREVSVDDSVCSCGYSFNTVAMSAPKEGKAYKSRSRGYKGGKVLALVALLFLLVFAYIIVIPECAIRPQEITSFDNGILQMPTADNEGVVNFYGVSIVMMLIATITENPAAFGTFISQNFAEFAICVLTVLVMLCMVIHLIVCIVRLFSGKRSKRSNTLYCILAIISTIWIGLWAICYYLIPTDAAAWLVVVRNVFVPQVATGYVLFALPLYFWFFYIYSACARVRKMKEGVA